MLSGNRDYRLSVCCGHGCSEIPVMGLPNLAPFAMWCKHHSPKQGILIETSLPNVSQQVQSNTNNSTPSSVTESQTNQFFKSENTFQIRPAVSAPPASTKRISRCQFDTCTNNDILFTNCKATTSWCPQHAPRDSKDDKLRKLNLMANGSIQQKVQGIFDNTNPYVMQQLGLQKTSFIRKSLSGDTLSSTSSEYATSLTSSGSYSSAD